MTNSSKAKVIFGDSRKLDQLLPQKSVDLVLTGPPYWDEVVYSEDKEQLSKIESYTQFLQEISKVWQGCSLVLKDGGILAIWAHDLLRGVDGGHKYIPFHLDISKTVPDDLVLRNIYVWDRYLDKDRGEINNNQVGTRVQYVLIFQKKGVHKNIKEIKESLRRIYWQPVWHRKTTPKLLGSQLLFKTVFTLAKPFSGYLAGISSKLGSLGVLEDDHKFKNYLTECPEDISDLLIKLFSSSGDTILDPFAGSGTSLVSALKQNRKCIGVEINKDCKKIIEGKLNGDVEFI